MSEGARSPAGAFTTLPPALLAQAAQRLRIMGLLYAGVFLCAGVLPLLLIPDERAAFLGTTTRWLPTALSIASGVSVAIVAGRPRLSGETIVALGLGYQVLGSIGIACAEYLQPQGGTTTMSPYHGLSWVAVWILSFTLTVPAPPAMARVAALVSASIVPLVAALAVAMGYLPRTSALEFFLHVVLPYLVVVVIADVGSRVAYRLGVDLKRALDLGSYQLEERLGMGGMGEVWRARHRLLARPAAVKLIRPEILEAATGARQSDLRLRFEREAQTTAQLQSPHTIDLFDYGVTDDGAFYYVMELLDGFDLKTLIEKFGPIPAGRAVHLLTQACHSLAEAHAVGIVHRDISPANVFVCRYGRDVDFVKVLDFGLVRPQAGPHDESRVDRVGGTPAFMAPEQVTNERVIDGRADIYALGCVGYWLLTGALVFDRPSGMAMAIAQTQDVPTAPSARTELAIPPSLDALVLACLAKDPGERPPTAEALAHQLATLDGVEPWTTRDARAWWHLHRPVEASRRRLMAETTAVRVIR